MEKEAENQINSDAAKSEEKAIKESDGEKGKSGSQTVKQVETLDTAMALARKAEHKNQPDPQRAGYDDMISEKDGDTDGGMPRDAKDIQIKTEKKMKNTNKKSILEESMSMSQQGPMPTGQP